MTTVTLKPATLNKDGAKVIVLRSPFNPAMSAKAKALGGKWLPNDKAWAFDPRDTDRVRELCQALYGIDPLADEAPETVTVRMNLSGRSFDQEFWFAGREVLNRPGRDSSVRLGNGVVLLSGGFGGHGGSARYPVIGTAQADTVIEIRDLPKSLVEAEAPGFPQPLFEVVQTADAAEKLHEVAAKATVNIEAQAPSAVERILAEIAALPEPDQAAIRNELLKRL